MIVTVFNRLVTMSEEAFVSVSMEEMVVVRTEPTTSQSDTDLQDGDSGIEANKSDVEHVYNSQMFNYDMIVDMMDEVWEEVCHSTHQLLLIENKLRDMRSRYVRLVQKRGESAAYGLKQQIVTVEGVRDMYEEYYARKQEKLNRLSSYSL